jgi:hypothetical protein
MENSRASSPATEGSHPTDCGVEIQSYRINEGRKLELYQQPARWWFASTVIPLLAVRKHFSSCALIFIDAHWLQYLFTEILR